MALANILEQYSDFARGSPLPAQRLWLRLVDSSYSLGARLGWLTNKSTPLICGEHAVNETQNQCE